jgi:hypothetical protein
MSGAMATPDPGTDPTAGAGAAMPMPDDTGGGDNVLVTITKNDDGSYLVYAGDEPDAGGSDMSEDDTDAMGAAGAAPATTGGAGMGATQGQPADSIGAALKLALDILNADKSSEGAPGNADDQFMGGFNASKSPTPATGPSQKY